METRRADRGKNPDGGTWAGPGDPRRRGPRDGGEDRVDTPRRGCGLPTPADSFDGHGAGLYRGVRNRPRGWSVSVESENLRKGHSMSTTTQAGMKPRVHVKRRNRI
jgi:hypothetical protein